MDEFGVEIISNLFLFSISFQAVSNKQVLLLKNWALNVGSVICLVSFSSMPAPQGTCRDLKESGSKEIDGEPECLKMNI